MATKLVSPMKIRLFILFLSLLPFTVQAQEYSSSFNVLRMPAATHVAAVGGQNVSLIEDCASVGWANPALYANVTDMTLGLNFMTYSGGSSLMGAHFVKAFGERHTLATGIQYMNYGSMDETNETGQVLGSFSAKDMVLGVGYSYLLSDRWSGGANLKMVYSKLAEFSSLAAAVDVGLNYYDEERDLSVSAVLQNIGTQLKAYDDGLHSHLPFVMAIGMTKGMAHLPIRFHITMTDVTRWKSDYYALPDKDDETVSFSKKLLNHFVLGAEIMPIDNMYLSLGYNFRRAYELKAAGSSALAGFSAGGGMQLKNFSFGLSYAQYHKASNSVMFQAGYSF